MLTSKDLYIEIEALEKVLNEETDPYKKANLKGLILNLRLAHNNRTNLTIIMEKLGAEKIKPQAINNGPRT